MPSEIPNPGSQTTTYVFQVDGSSEETDQALDDLFGSMCSLIGQAQNVEAMRRAKESYQTQESMCIVEAHRTVARNDRIKAIPKLQLAGVSRDLIGQVVETSRCQDIMNKIRNTLQFRYKSTIYNKPNTLGQTDCSSKSNVGELIRLFESWTAAAK